MRAAFSATLTSEQRAGQGGSQLHLACGLRPERLALVAAPVERQHLELCVLERDHDGLAGLMALASAGAASVGAASEAVARAYAEHSEAAASAPGGRRRRAAAGSEEGEGPPGPEEAVQAADSAEAAAADHETEAAAAWGAVGRGVAIQCAAPSPTQPQPQPPPNPNPNPNRRPQPRPPSTPPTLALTSYCATRALTHTATGLWRAMGLVAAAYSAALSDSARRALEARFQRCEIDILCANRRVEPQ